MRLEESGKLCAEQHVKYPIYRDFAMFLPSPEKRKLNSAARSAILHLILAVEGELSATSATITSLRRQARFEASPQGPRSEVYSAALEPCLKNTSP